MSSFTCPAFLFFLMKHDLLLFHLNGIYVVQMIFEFWSFVKNFLIQLHYFRILERRWNIFYPNSTKIITKVKKHQNWNEKKTSTSESGISKKCYLLFRCPGSTFRANNPIREWWNWMVPWRCGWSTGSRRRKELRNTEGVIRKTQNFHRVLNLKSKLKT